VGERRAEGGFADGDALGRVQGSGVQGAGLGSVFTVLVQGSGFRVLPEPER
jgi:hypothetical protein